MRWRWDCDLHGSGSAWHTCHRIGIQMWVFHVFLMGLGMMLIFVCTCECWKNLFSLCIVCSVHGYLERCLRLIYPDPDPDSEPAKPVD